MPSADPAVLAFDCSTAACSAAVLAAGAIRAARFQALARGQAEVLMPMIAEVMAEAGLGWPQLGLIGVVVGPGTFTGLRIALAAARGMAFAAGLPVAGVTSCAAVAHGVPEAERRGHTLLVAVDGKREDLFVQPFAADLTPLAPPRALMAAEAARLAEGPVLIAGDAGPRLAEALPGARLSAAPPLPDARIVAALALAQWRAGTALPPEPLYLRPPDVTLPPGAPAA
ncbi:tRNA threonylcarbamoyladenosine biosynthesis protein TsaB [mine drainage metagenome]|uniref:tRNA threonylcarbamoyladenosine biosynthesis protein TsaB n=1 Tax=mine drainage metagenome TaxID=410659 RepID=A0A1J5SME1_9ZZZZ